MNEPVMSMTTSIDKEKTNLQLKNVAQESSIGPSNYGSGQVESH